MSSLDPSPSSVWRRGDAPRSFPPLPESATCDVCIVGAGIAGISTAYRLAREGRSVIVVDDGDVAGGQTCRSTGHLASAIDDRFVQLERVRGSRIAQIAANSHAIAIDSIEEIVRRERIDCGFTRLDGYLFLPPGRPLADLEAEREAAERAGIHVKIAPRAPIAGLDTGPCLVFSQQGQCDPAAYVDGLARAAVELGVRIHAGTHVDTVDGGSPCRVQCGPHEIRASAVVIATNIPFHERVAVQTKLAAYTTYVISARVESAPFPPILLWDDADPYHYVRWNVVDGATEIIVGGEDHRSGATLENAYEPHRALEEWMRANFTGVGDVTARWVGQVVETLDGLAFIGRDPGHAANVYVATGDSGMGLTHGSIAGLLLTDLILGRDNPWADAYEARRKPLRATPRYLRENATTLAQYADWLVPGGTPSATRARGSGVVAKHGLRPVAIYTDEHGVSVEMSAVCPHLGCIVHWNDADKTWNCPCHGSRFEATGGVVNGPANRALARSPAAEAEATPAAALERREHDSRNP